MVRIKLLYISLLFFMTLPIFAQNDVQIGRGLNELRQQSQGAFYDYSDPSTLNIKVAVWGFVRFPGKYIVPSYSSVEDLLSFAGGPTNDAHLDNLRLYRTDEDSTQSLVKFNYNDLFWNEKLETISEIPDLLAGDILLVPGEPRLYFRDYVTLTLSIVSTLISLSILIINIVK